MQTEYKMQSENQSEVSCNKLKEMYEIKQRILTCTFRSLKHGGWSACVCTQQSTHCESLHVKWFKNGLFFATLFEVYVYRIDKQLSAFSKNVNILKCYFVFQVKNSFLVSLHFVLCLHFLLSLQFSVCILNLVCTLYLVSSLQFTVCILYWPVSNYGLCMCREGPLQLYS